MFIRTLALVSASAAFLLVAAPANAQDYSYPAPSPRALADSGNGTEWLAADSQADVYGSWDFNYIVTPDNNLFVSRVFVSDLGSDTVGSFVQIDCGRGLFRHTIEPLLFVNGEDPGVSITDVPVNQWLTLNRQTSFGQAIMRSCEAAAREEGTTWAWL
jgi:hypothetical protein